MKKFNFEKFLEQRGYEKEEIKDWNRTVYATNYQKEVEEDNWNSITLHTNGKLTACPPTGILSHIDAEVPLTKKEAEKFLTIIEKK